MTTTTTRAGRVSWSFRFCLQFYFQAAGLRRLFIDRERRGVFNIDNLLLFQVQDYFEVTGDFREEDDVPCRDATRTGA